MPHDSSRRRHRSRAFFTCGLEAMEPRLACAVGIALTLVRDTGARANDRITADPTLVISRALAAGQRLEYRINGGSFQPAEMASPRRFVPEGITADGRYRVAARVVHANGRPRAMGPALTFRLDRSAAPPQVSLQHDSGVSSTDRITSNATLMVTGREKNAVVQYSRDHENWSLATAVWGAYAPRPGLNRWHVRQVDAAGNVSDPVTVEFDLDADRHDRVVRMEGQASGALTVVAGQRMAWVLEFEKPMYAAAVNGTLPGIQFTFRGEQLLARLSGGSGTHRLEYAYVFSAGQAGTGTLIAPESVCLCYGGIITDAAGNRILKHALPSVV